MLCLDIMDQYFPGDEYEHVLILSGYRLSSVKISNIPSGIKVHEVDYKQGSDSFDRIKGLVDTLDVSQFFLFHAYRPIEVFLLTHLRTATKNLVEDGVLFYHNRKQFLLFSRFKQTFKIYRELWSQGYHLTMPIFYWNDMWNSRLVDNLYMTRPDMFIDQANKKNRVKVDLLATPQSIERALKIFDFDSSVDRSTLDGCLFYVSAKMYKIEHVNREIEVLKQIIEKIKPQFLLIKLHPAARKIQVDEFVRHFGNAVLLNNIPSELYIATAKNSIILSVASTSIYYYNSKCRYFALKTLFQEMGIYARHKDIRLPSHVQIVSNLDQIVP